MRNYLPPPPSSSPLPINPSSFFSVGRIIACISATVEELPSHLRDILEIWSAQSGTSVAALQPFTVLVASVQQGVFLDLNSHGRHQILRIKHNTVMLGVTGRGKTPAFDACVKNPLTCFSELLELQRSSNIENVESAIRPVPFADLLDTSSKYRKSFVPASTHKF